MDFDSLLKLMVQKNASDLFITAGMAPSLKVNGKITPVTKNSLTPGQALEVVEGIMSEEQIQEFHDSHECNFAISASGIGRFRVSAFIQRNHAGMVLRKIETHIPSLDDLSLPALIKNLAIHQHDGCIITQREVGLDTESFEVALKNTLRQAPDVILIGEIRTRDTMEHAITFAETGHLCLATLHANNANQALDRIINFFPEDRRNQLLMDLSLNLKGIVAQQLIPTPDGKGRRAAIEVLINTPLAADIIRKGAIHELKELMRKSKITYEDAIHSADSANELRLMIKLGDKAAAENMDNAVEGMTLLDDDESGPGGMSFN